MKYSIVQQPNQKGTKFTVDEETGEVSTNKVFDREGDDGKFVSVTVKATDQGEPSLEGVCSFTVEITDVNDNPPLFDRQVSRSRRAVAFRCGVLTCETPPPEIRRERETRCQHWHQHSARLRFRRGCRQQWRHHLQFVGAVQYAGFGLLRNPAGVRLDCVEEAARRKYCISIVLNVEQRQKTNNIN